MFKYWFQLPTFPGKIQPLFLQSGKEITNILQKKSFVYSIVQIRFSSVKQHECVDPSVRAV
jgi:hypothetical protein